MLGIEEVYLDFLTADFLGAEARARVPGPTC